MRVLLGLLAAVAGWAADTPRLVYSKSFPGSRPAFVEVRLEGTGDCEYREAPNEDNPVKFRLSEAEVREIFALAAKLDRFTRPLEANLKVANMGIKACRFEEGATRNEVKFNYAL